MNFNFRSYHTFGKAVGKALTTISTLLTLVLFCANNTVAQLDPTFGTNGVAATNVVGIPVATFLLPDGKIFIISDYFGGLVRFARFNSDGTPDNTYGTSGVVEPVIPFTNQNGGHHIYTALRQADGKVVLAGYDNNHGFITRFSENGTLDTSFGSNGVDRTSIGTGYDDFNNIILLPDGKILGVGTAIPTGSTDLRDIFLIRYSADGVLDLTFGNGSGYQKHADTPMWGYSIVEMKVFRQSDGKLVVYRKFTSDSISARIRRFSEDGTLDNTYPNIYLNNGSFSKLALQPDDKLLVAGIVNKNDALERKQTDISILRYTTSGSLDVNFGTNGNATLDLTSYFDDVPKALMVLPDGQILVSVLTFVPLNRSVIKGSKISLARLSADGNTATGKFLQTDATAHISQNYSQANSDSFLTIQPDGKILSTYHNGGGSTSLRLLLTRAVGVPVQTYRFHGLPFDFVYDPLGIKATAEVMVFRPSNQKWYPYNDFAGYYFGLSEDIPVPSDYVGNFESELAVFRPSNGTWYIARTKVNAETNFLAVPWGQSGDIPAPADYDGDGKSDIAVFRPSTGVWYNRNSSDNSLRATQWGFNGDKPVAGDYDGDGFYDVAVWRPSTGTWYILRSSDGQPNFVNFGLNGDVPVQEDFDGDGITDIAVWRPSNGTWYVIKSSDGNFLYFSWGISTDIAIPADYDGDLKTDYAVWRPGERIWYIYRSSDNTYQQFTWGVPTDIPPQARN